MYDLTSLELFLNHVGFLKYDRLVSQEVSWPCGAPAAGAGAGGGIIN